MESWNFEYYSFFFLSFGRLQPSQPPPKKNAPDLNVTTANGKQSDYSNFLL